ncbi:MAG: glycosyltransferase family 4 protein, partial [Flavobacteriales bacterium]|nr:glycosyltransferase family 4 protein [Flavobacteriales bacterium]
MRVGFDAKRAFLNHTGLGNYSRGVIDLIAKHESVSSVFLYTPKNTDSIISSEILNLEKVTVKTPPALLKGPLSSVWRSRLITDELKKDNLDVFHGLSNELPSGIEKVGMASLVTIHDLIFLHYPEFYKAIDRKIYTAKVKHACSVATRIIATSQQTADDLVGLLEVDQSKISVVYQGCDERFENRMKKDELEQVKNEYSLPEKFILSVGTIEPRKNAKVLVNALSLLDNTEVKLVLVGRKTDYATEVLKAATSLGLSERVVILDNVSSQQLPSIYQLATVFALPSLMEGFGIPVLEAMTSGVPVVVSEKSCLTEVCGKVGIAIDPNNPSTIAKAINCILKNEGERQRMIAAGMERKNRFSQ